MRQRHLALDPGENLLMILSLTLSDIKAMYTEQPTRKLCSSADGVQMVVTLGHGLEAQKYQLKIRVVDMGQLGDKNQKGPL